MKKDEISWGHTMASAQRRLILFAMVHVCAAGSLLAAPPQPRELPAPTGSHAIGRTTYYWTDDSRPETYSDDANDHRDVRVDVWYPAAANNDAARGKYYVDLPKIGKKIGPESMFLSTLKLQAMDNAPIAADAERFPVLLFSPGYGTNACQYAGLIEELASHGYVVAAVDHPYFSRAVAFPDGRVVMVIPMREIEIEDQKKHEIEYAQRMTVLSGDLRFVLDQLTRLDGETGNRFAGRLDLAKVGVLGHSIGGVAAAEAGRDDSRFRAIANLDGHYASLPFRTRDDGAVLEQPLVELTDGFPQPTDKQLAEWKVTREEFDKQRAEMIKRVNGAMSSIKGGAYRVTIRGVRHGSFGDMAMWDLGPIEERQRRIQSIRDYTRAFFDKHLKGQGGTLIDAEKGPYAEASVERFGAAK